MHANNIWHKVHLQDIGNIHEKNMAIKHSSSDITHIITMKCNRKNRYMYKNESKDGSYQPLTTLSCRRSSSLPFHLHNLNDIKWKPSSRWSHRRLLNLKRTKQNQEEQQIFLVFSILKQSKEKANKKENIFGFLNCNSKIKKTK